MGSKTHPGDEVAMAKVVIAHHMQTSFSRVEVLSSSKSRVLAEVSFPHTQNQTIVEYSTENSSIVIDCEAQ